MRVTIISYDTPELLHGNAVCHECTCGEFAQDVKAETRRYLKEQKRISEIDLFWHLDDYCEKKYGVCHWQIVSTRSLLSMTAVPIKDEKA